MALAYLGKEMRHDRGQDRRQDKGQDKGQGRGHVVRQGDDRGYQPLRTLQRLHESHAQNWSLQPARRQDDPQDDPCDLLPAWLRAQLPRLYATGHRSDPLVICRYVIADIEWSWYALEFDGNNLFFGIVDTFCRELRYFALRELRATRGPSGMTIQRDVGFAPTRLSYLRTGRIGRIGRIGDTGRIDHRGSVT
jgi:hypothetical protein